MDNPLIKTLLQEPNFKEAITIEVAAREWLVGSTYLTDLHFQYVVLKQYEDGGVYHNRAFHQVSGSKASDYDRVQFRDFVLTHAIASIQQSGRNCIFYIHYWHNDPTTVKIEAPTSQRRNVLFP